MAQKNQPLRLPPQSVEAEQAVLGCMLIDPEAVPKVLHVLTEKSFYKTAHSIFILLWVPSLKKIKQLIISL